MPRSKVHRFAHRGTPRSASVLAITLWLLACAKPASALQNPVEPSADAPEGDDRVQELVLTTPWRLQERRELQGTLSSNFARDLDSWASELEIEFGVASWLQTSFGTTLHAAPGEARTIEAGLLVAPWPELGRWRLAAAVMRDWAIEDNAGEASTGVSLLAGIAGSRDELHVDAGFESEEGETRWHAAAATVRVVGAWCPLLEARADFAAGTIYGLSPGIAWHPAPGFELLVGAPVRFAGGDVTAGAALRVSFERGLHP